VNPVAVLGCGPSGLIAAHACVRRNVPVVVYSRGAEPSYLQGSQYLHEPIPAIIGYTEGMPITYVTNGTPEEYRRKVHGKFWDGQVAAEDFIPHHDGWDIRTAYRRLWTRYGNLVQDMDFTGIEDAAKLVGSQKFSMVVSTLPRKLWAQPGDEFIYSQGWATSGELARVICQGIGSNSIVCDGTNKVTWSRASRVFGHYTVEWPWNDGERPTYGNEEAKIARLMKPLRCKTDVHTGDALVSGGPPWVFAGRYGEWKKGVVVTDTWAVVNRALEEYVL